MPIYAPGKRSRSGHVQSAKREAVAVLQLTAMVLVAAAAYVAVGMTTTMSLLPEAAALLAILAVAQLTGLGKASA